MPSKKSSLTPEILLMDFPPDIRELAGQMRQFIRETVLKAEERAYPTWRAIGYRHPVSGYFCGIFPFAGRVDLAFEFGVLLPDPAKILEGKGTQVRYVHLAPGEELPLEEIRDLLLEAVNLPGSRAAKLEMIKAGAKRAD